MRCFLCSATSSTQSNKSTIETCFTSIWSQRTFWWARRTSRSSTSGLHSMWMVAMLLWAVRFWTSERRSVSWCSIRYYFHLSSTIRCRILLSVKNTMCIVSAALCTTRSCTSSWTIPVSLGRRSFLRCCQSMEFMSQICWLGWLIRIQYSGIRFSSALTTPRLVICLRQKRLSLKWRSWVFLSRNLSSLR